tara:strand:- start:5 stop:652 length:648 start_codon:yes stop_codon:yes gene_type:complete
MQIVLDYREHKLNAIFKDKKIEYSLENLIIGDIYISKDDVHYTIERKTLDDFSSSIIDGRYSEQKQRLLASNSHIIYIIEGHTKSNHGVPLSTLYSCMFTMQQRDRIIVLRSYDIEETVDILLAMIKKIGIGTNEENAQKALVIKKKSDNADIYLDMLCCIPGISSKIAYNIIEKFPSVSNLCYFIDETNSLECIPKIGKKLSAKIVNLLQSKQN